VRYDLIALAVVLAGILVWMYRRDRARIKAARAGFFRDCLDLFDACRVTQDAVDMPVLDGRYRGHRVRVEPIIDHVNLRKLPSLWLLVTLRAPTPYGGVLDFLVRPQNTEFYSPSAALPVAIEPPPGWPAHAVLRTDQPEAMPPAEVIGRHIDFFADPRAKELVVTPRAIRLVYQASQAQRSHYLVLRQAEFADLTLDPARLRDMLDRAVALHDDLLRSHHGRRAEAQAA
jgi:hypothetical protein